MKYWAMYFVLLFVASGSSMNLLEEVENCDTDQLNVCVKRVPHTPPGLPKSKEELDKYCSAYLIGITCMDAWINRCLPTDSQKVIQKRMSGARAIMRFLCNNDTALRKEYLKEMRCWIRVSADWSSCANELQRVMDDINDQAHLQTYFNEINEYCCARDAYLSCVAQVARTCSTSGATLLRRMAWVLAQDITECPLQHHPVCAATPLFTPILTALPFVLQIILYLLQL